MANNIILYNKSELIQSIDLYLNMVTDYMYCKVKFE